MVSFPAPVGGTPLPIDFAPSVLFAVLYGLLVPLAVYRLFHRRSRTVLLIGTLAFAIQGIVIFSLRAFLSRNEKPRLSSGILNYTQNFFALGSIGIANDLVNIVCCLLVNPTYGPERYGESPAARTKESMMEPPQEGVTQDMPKQRFWIRRFADFWGLAFLASTVPGIIANSKFRKGLESQKDADNIYKLRLVSSGVCIFLTIGLLASVAWGKWYLNRISTRGVIVITAVVGLVNVIAVYRLAVMPLRETSLSDPITLNTGGGKAAFYILHVLPEWLASAILFGVNVRKTFGTGPFGDWRRRDETEKEKEKRLKSEAKKVAKKGPSAGNSAERTNEDDIELSERESQPLVEKEGVETIVRTAEKHST